MKCRCLLTLPWLLCRWARGSHKGHAGSRKLVPPKHRGRQQDSDDDFIDDSDSESVSDDSGDDNTNSSQQLHSRRGDGSMGQQAGDGLKVSTVGISAFVFAFIWLFDYLQTFLNKFRSSNRCRTGVSAVFHISDQKNRCTSFSKAFHRTEIDKSNFLLCAFIEYVGIRCNNLSCASIEYVI